MTKLLIVVLKYHKTKIWLQFEVDLSLLKKYHLDFIQI